MTNARTLDVDVDQEIGRRLQAMRKARGISQKALGKQIGITYQQIFKYEAGINRVTVSTLYVIAMALGCPVTEMLPPTYVDRRNEDPEIAAAMLVFAEVPPERRWHIIRQMQREAKKG